jgi:hypothetical protein
MKFDMVTVHLAVPRGSTEYMDALSDLRDDASGCLIEWAVKRSGSRVENVDGDDPEIADVFESNKVTSWWDALKRDMS